MNILITRPSPHGEQLVKKLLYFGKFAYHLPLIFFSAGKTLSSLEYQLNLLSEGDLLCIVSQNAIKYAHNQLLDVGISWPTKLSYYSIGHATSIMMHKLSGILVKYPKYQETSENLLRLPELMYSYGKRALILRGNNGRTILDHTLQRRGVFVASYECYSRLPLQYDGEEQSSKLLELNIKIVVVTSGEILQQLYYLIPEFYRTSWLLRCKLIVVSLRLANLARRLGWTDIIIAQSANNEALVHVLIKHS
ncbi:uroporphyrinogen-III synthase [Blochmannia endosymbiont of Camponotus sp. C-046]|uniref:uroporphyrinogen-III synthase n=1 Tax=Blochmannia endosymbiont of Camponotus sp. C-046 TaxID=2945589 RepID=UPI00202535A5|nr:uroporphyrinogen-III synthase [Blochmannia endosymbiont of Camponotus sp. C-046]URJ28739.1 uroporphyrinogen-III synthase [Blochmannia endosymbiont of Camponotus sp. C-046]